MYGYEFGSHIWNLGYQYVLLQHQPHYMESTDENAKRKRILSHIMYE